jgi:hypothetical protein
LFPEKIHNTFLYLLDKVTLPLASSVELAIDAVLPVHRPFPAFPSRPQAAA